MTPHEIAEVRPRLVAARDTVTQLVAGSRRVIHEVPGAAAAAGAVRTGHDYRDPGEPKIARYDEEARATLVSALVDDALSLLAHLPAQPPGPAANAIGLLALIAGQDVEPAEGSDGTDGRWTIARRTAQDRAVSVAAPTRHIHKNRTRHQNGFKAHMSLEPETGLFTAVELTGSSGGGSHDAAAAERLPGLCTGCPLRQRCTTSQSGRVLSVLPPHALLAAARRAAAWARRTRQPPRPYRGIAKNSIWLIHRAAALNLRRLANLGLTRINRTWALA